MCLPTWFEEYSVQPAIEVVAFFFLKDDDGDVVKVAQNVDVRFCLVEVFLEDLLGLLLVKARSLEGYAYGLMGSERGGGHDCTCMYVRGI